jgi:hypothetical protein
MNPIVDTIASIFKPIADVIDHITVSGEDKTRLQMAQLAATLQASGAAQNYEQALLEGQQKIIEAEASSSNWLASSWRPITMLVFLALVVADSFRWLPSPLAPQAWTLLQIGIGGYTAGRSVEKIAPVIVKALTKK